MAEIRLFYIVIELSLKKSIKNNVQVSLELLIIGQLPLNLFCKYVLTIALTHYTTVDSIDSFFLYELDSNHKLFILMVALLPLFSCKLDDCYTYQIISIIIGRCSDLEYIY